MCLKNAKPLIKKFLFIQKVFFTGITFISSLVSTTPLSCISVNNQACKIRPETINLNSNKPVFYPFSIKTIKCSGSCNNINNPYAKICVPDAVKDLNVKVFNLMSRSNETRHVNAIDHAMLVSIEIMKTVSVEKGWLTN